MKAPAIGDHLQKKSDVSYDLLKTIGRYTGFIFLIVSLLHNSKIHQVGIYTYRYLLFMICLWSVFFVLPKLIFFISENREAVAAYILVSESVILTVFIIELSSRFILFLTAKPSLNTIGTNLYNVSQDPNLGYVLKKNDQLHALKRFSDGELIYDVTYMTDEYGRRTVGQPYRVGNKHLILFGCSFAYGEGLNDSETLQFMLGNKLHDYNVYNYATYGYGPQHMLALIETGRLPDEIDSKSGIAIYVFLKDHIIRACGSTRTPTFFDSPCYVFNKDKRIERKGSYSTGRPTITKIYRCFAEVKPHSAFLKLFNIDLPLRLSEQDTRLVVEIIKESKKKYLAQFNGKFYVLMHPLECSMEVKTLLEENNIDVLYYPLGADRENDDYRIRGDGHPNAKLNRVLSSAIVSSFSKLI